MQRSPAHHRSSGALVALGACRRCIDGASRLGFAAFAGGSASFAISGATTDTISSITVRAESSAPVSFTIGSTSAFVGFVGDIDIGTSTGHVTLFDGRVLNNLGSARAHLLRFLQVNGQILGDIVCEAHSSGPSDLLSLRSGSVATPGGIFGDITVEHGKADLISVFDGDIGTPTSPVTDFEYVFELLSDCNDNGIDDATEIAQNRSLDLFPEDGFIDSCYSGTCGLDYNGDGNVDQDDVQCLAQAIGGNCSCLADGADPDFNQDGNIDLDDVLDLGSSIAGDPCPW